MLQREKHYDCVCNSKQLEGTFDSAALLFAVHVCYNRETQCTFVQLKHLEATFDLFACLFSRICSACAFRTAVKPALKTL